MAEYRIAPGLDGFILGQQDAERRTLGQLQREGTLAQLQEMQMRGDVQREDMAERRTLAGLLAQTGGDVSRAIPALVQRGTPQSIALAAKLKGLTAKPEGQPIGSGGLRLPDGTIVPPAARPTAPTASPIAKLIAERDALPENDPRRKLYDNAITRQTTHQPSVNVYSGSLTAAVDAAGNPVFVQPSGRPGVDPRVVPGVRPPPSPAAVKAAAGRAEQEATVESIRARVNRMSGLIQGNTGIVGPAGIARRMGETAAGVVAPGVPTPAIDYENEKNLMVADIRKMIEKDPNLSNRERETLSQTLGGGTMQTPGSAVRTLNNVLQFIEGKKLRGPGRSAGGRLRFDANGNPIP